MSWLSDWLKTVIVVVLIAAFVDLLLPSNKMQRYVKTVLSLFILLALLSPIINVLRGGWDVDKLLAEAEREQAAIPVLGQVSGKLDEQSITRAGELLKQSGEQQTAELAERQIAGSIKDEITRETAYEAVEVWVKTAKDSEGKPFVSSVEATLRLRASVTAEGTKGTKQTGRKTPEAGAGQGNNRNMEPMKPVEPVKPVEIEVRVGADRQGSDQMANDAGTEAERQTKDEVLQLLERNWGVSPERAVIRFLIRQKS